MERLAVFGNALERLTVVVDLSRQQKLNEFERDSLIKRFEFTYEMAWKLMMSFDDEDAAVDVTDSIIYTFHPMLLELQEKMKHIECTD